jgi:zinc/manganese transport system substrate-binding protein
MTTSLWRLAGIALGILPVAAGATAACAKTVEAVASFTVLADMVKQVGGDHVHVTSLVPPNGDPHEYEPTPDDARKLKAADVVFTSGLGLEGWFARLAKASGYAGAPVVASDGIKPRKMEEDGKTVTDPHAWNSIPNAEVYVENIEKALAKADPEDAGAFKQNAAAYEAKLKELDTYAHAQVNGVPPSDRKVLTTHDALSYFGAAYGVKFISPLGFSTENEPSAAQVASVIKQIKAEHVHTYFFENSNDPRLVKQIGDATGAQPGGELFVEALSPPDGPAPTYAAMFKSNVDKLVTGMKAAPKG